MSKEIEQRVVEMRFDHQNFEKNVAETMDSLSKLDKSLNEMDRGKTFEALDNAAKKVDLKSLTDETGTLARGFSALEEVAVGAFRKIGDKVADVAMQIGNAVTTMNSFNPENIVAGWSKFGEKTTSVSTLVSQGYELEEVNEQLNRLNWYTDETSYNFTDMTSNIAKFTAAGQGLTDSVTAMEGIANWAALSGQNATVASRAMYQLSQAMGSGTMRKQDWMSVQNANMDTQEFRQHAIDAAIALGTLKKVGEDTYSSLVGKADAWSINQFADNLTEGAWFTSDVMMKVYQEYAGAVDLIYEDWEKNGGTASDAIERLGGQIDEFALKAFRSAQEARTWADVVDSVKDAVSTGWMNTFEMIIGDYQEAKALYTDLANELYDIFAEGGNVRNEVLSIWKELGGRDLLFANDEETGNFGALWNIIHSIEDALGALKGGFGDVFMPDSAEEFADALLKVTQRFKDLTKRFKMSDETAQKLRDTFGGLFAILDIGVQAVKAVFGGFKELVKVFSGVDTGILDTTAKFGNYLKELDKSIKENETFQKAVEKVTDVLKKVVTPIADFAKKLIELATNLKPLPEALKEAFGEERYERGAQALATIVEKLGQTFRDVGEELHRLGDGLMDAFGNIAAGLLGIDDKAKAVDELKARFHTLGETIYDWVLGGLETIAGFDFSKITAGISSAVTFILDHMPDLATAASNIGAWFGRVFEEIRSAVPDVFGALISFAGTAFEYIQTHSIWEFLQRVWEKIQEVWQTIQDAWNGDVDENSGLSKFIGELRSAVDATTPYIERFISVLKSLFAELTPGKVLVITFGAALVSTLFSIRDAFGSVETALNSAKTLIDKLTKKIGSTQVSAVKDFTMAITAMTGALVILSRVDPEGLKQAEIALGIMSGIAVAIEGLTAVLSKVITDDVAKRMEDVSHSLIAVTGSIGILAGSLKIISTVDTDNIINQLGALAGLLVEVVFTMAAISSAIPPTTNFKSLGLVGVASAMLILVSVLKKLAQVDISGIEDKLGPMVTIMGMFALIAKASENVKFSSGTGVLMLMVDMLVMIEVMKKLAAVDVDDILDALPQYITVLGLIEGLALAAKLAGDNALKAGGGLLAIVVAMKLLVNVIDTLGEMDAETVKQGEIAVAAMFGVFTVVMGFSKFAGDNAAKAGVGILAMSGAMMLLTGCIAVLGSMDAETVKQGEIAVAGMLTVFGIVIAIAGLGKDNKGIVASVAALTVAAGALTGALALLTLLPGDEVLQSAESLALVLGALGVTVRLVQGTEWKEVAAAVVAMGVMLAEAVTALAVLENFDGEHLIQSAESLAIVLGVLGALFGEFGVMTKFKIDPVEVDKMALAFDGMGALIAILVGVVGGLAHIPGVDAALDKGIEVLTRITHGEMLETIGVFLGMFAAMAAAGKFNISVADVTKMTAAFDAMVMIVTAMVTAVGAIFNALDSLDGEGSAIAKLDKGIEVLEKVGDAIGGLVGHLVGSVVGGALEALSSSLPGIAENLSSFGEKIGPFFESAKSIDDQAMSGVESLSSALLKLTAVGFLDGIRRLLGLGDLSSFGDSLNQLGTGLTGYATAVDGLNVDAIDRSATAVQALVDIQNNLDPAGGLWGALSGNQTLGKFGGNLAAFGKALKDYGDSVDGVNVDAITISAKAARSLVDVQNTMENAGGVAGFFTGSKTLGTFGLNLAAFGKALKDYGDSVDGLNADAIATSTKAARSLVDIQNTLENAGGIAGFFTGNQTIGQFGGSLKKFGEGLKEYGDTVDGLNISAIQVSVNAALVLAELDSALGTDAGAFAWLFGGGSNMDDFGKNLKKLGQGLKDYSDKIATVGWNDIETSVKYIKMIAETTGEIAGIDVTATENFEQATSNLANTGFSGFINTITDHLPQVKETASSFISMFGEGVTENLGVVNDLGVQISQEKIAGYLSDAEAQVAAGGTGVENIANGGQNALSEMTNLGTMVNETFTNSYLGENLTRLAAGETSVQEIAEGGLASAEQLLGNNGLGGYARSAVTNGILSDESEFRQTANTFVGWVADSAATASGTLQQAGVLDKDGFITGFLSGRGEARNAGEQVADQANKGAASVHGEMVNTGAYLIDGLIKGLNSRVGDLRRTAESVTGVVPTTTKNVLVTHSPSKLAEEIGEYWVDGLVIGISDTSELEKAVEALGNTLLTDVDAVLKDMDVVGSNATVELLNGMISATEGDTPMAAGDMAQFIQTWMANEMVKEAEANASTYRDLGSYTTTTIADGATSETWAMQDAGDEVRYQFEEGVLSDTWSLVDTGRSMAEYIAEGIRDNISSVVWAGNDLRSSLIDSVESIGSGISYSDISSSLETMPRTLLDAVAEAPTVEYPDALARSILDAVAEPPTAVMMEYPDALARSVLDAVAEPPTAVMVENLTNAGAAGMAGFTEGFRAEAPTAVRMVDTVMGRIVDTANTSLAIASPSKKFEEIGEFVVWGFILGLQEHLKEVHGAAGDMASEALSAVGEVVANLGDTSDEWVLEPVVRPVVDLSGIQELESFNRQLTASRSVDLASRASVEMQYANGQNDAIAAAVKQLTGQMSAVETAVGQLQNTVRGGLSHSIAQGVRAGLDGAGVYLSGRRVGEMTTDYQNGMRRRGGV